MADEGMVKTSLGWVELKNYSSNPPDTNSDRGGVAVVSGSLKIYDGSSWEGIQASEIKDGAVDNDALNAAAGKWTSGTLSDGTSAGGVFSWQNPESSKIIVDRVIIDITSAATDTSDSTMDIGTASDGSSSSDDLLDAASTQAVAILDNIDDTGSNGQSVVKMDENGGTTDYINASQDTADVSGMSGKYYIHYRTV